LGSVEFKSGKNEAAIKCFKAASNLNPSNSIIMCCIGNVWARYENPALMLVLGKGG